MKTTLIPKVNPIVELTAPILLKCRDGECGGCPVNTGKMLWVPRRNSSDTSTGITFSFQYNFFDKSAESTSPIKYNIVDGSFTINGSAPSYSNSPAKSFAVASHAVEHFPTLSPALMRGSSFQTFTYSFGGAGGWIFFRQPNPAANNVHDGLCFEYNHEKRLITFRSF